MTSTKPIKHLIITTEAGSDFQTIQHRAALAFVRLLMETMLGENRVNR